MRGAVTTTSSSTVGVESVSVVVEEVSETVVVVALVDVNIDAVVPESMVLVVISEVVAVVVVPESTVIVAVLVITVTALLMVKEVLSEMVFPNAVTTLT